MVVVHLLFWLLFGLREFGVTFQYQGFLIGGCALLIALQTLVQAIRSG